MTFESAILLSPEVPFTAVISINKKTKEMIVDFWRSRPEHTPLCISNREVDRVESVKFLGVQITDDLSWSKNTVVLQWSIRDVAISTWFSSRREADKKVSQGVV